MHGNSIYLCGGLKQDNGKHWPDAASISNVLKYVSGVDQTFEAFYQSLCYIGFDFFRAASCYLSNSCASWPACVFVCGSADRWLYGGVTCACCVCVDVWVHASM